MRWNVGTEKLETYKFYKYLGVWLNERRSAQKHREDLLKRRGALIHSLRQLQARMASPTAAPILKVTKALLLPSLSYGNLAFPEKLENVLEEAQVKAYKILMGILKRARKSRVRAELGLIR